MIESGERESGGTSVVHKAAVAHPPLVATEPGENPRQANPQLAEESPGKQQHCGSTSTSGTSEGAAVLSKVAEAESKALDNPLGGDGPSKATNEAVRETEHQLEIPRSDPGKAPDETREAGSKAKLLDYTSIMVPQPSTITANYNNFHGSANNFGQGSSLFGAAMVNPILPAKSRTISLDKGVETNPKPNDISSSSPTLAADPTPSSDHASPPAPPPAKSKSGSSLRRGKWTVEEEAYVARVIQDFNSGFLNAPAGTTLRSYLSEKLQCDPMRITKKFTGEACIGKRVFHPAVRSASNSNAIDKAQAELEVLERRWRRRLEMQQRESAKKAASSTSGRTHGFHSQAFPPATAAIAGKGGSGAADVVVDSSGPHVLAQTASWLNRASTVLQGSAGIQPKKAIPVQAGAFASSPQLKYSLTLEQAQALQTLPKKELESQMKEVERLIHEGPIIQQTTAGIPHILDRASSGNHFETADGVSSDDAVSEGQQTPPEPADKRMRTGAEDAEVMVGFLAAVRASTTAGPDSLSN